MRQGVTVDYLLGMLSAFNERETLQAPICSIETLHLAKKPVKKTRKKVKKTRAPSWRKFFVLSLLSLIVVSLIGLFIVDKIITQRFSGSKWSLPTHVYSRALELYAGLALSRKDLIWELDKLGYRQVHKLTGPGQYDTRGQSINIHTRAFQFWDENKPAQILSLTFKRQKLTHLRDQRGKTLALARLEPLRIGGIYPKHLEDRQPVRLEALPPFFVETLIAVEDKDFYSHYGISLRGLSRALLNNLQPGRATQGGSTLTQQLIKNLYLTQDRTLLRKGMEIVMALLLEHHYSKGEILEAYINEIYLGQAGKRAIHGFGMASQHYFHQPLAELELHQVALLVAIAKGASYYNPRRHPERVLKRRNLVLSLLEKQDVIKTQAAHKARQETLALAQHAGTTTNPFPAYLDLVKRELRQDYNEDVLHNSGLRVFTHFDPQVQYKLETAVRTKLSAIERRKGLKNAPLEAASLIVRIGTGEVLALSGGRRANFAGFNRALDIRRPIGSTIKPAVYLTALEQDDTYTLASLISDAPVSIPTEDGSIWQPHNFDHQSHGDLPLFQTLGHSYNQATVRLGMALGLNNVSNTLRRLGYQAPLQEVPALLLGATSMSPFEVATLYHTIAANGSYTPLGSIRSVYTSDHQALKRYPYQLDTRFSSEHMHLLHYALQVVMREGTGQSAYRRLSTDTTVAGKTGTSNDQRDSWFSGFGDNYLTVVWVGRDDNAKMPLTGSSGALQIWTEVMSQLPLRSLAFTRPENVRYHWIDQDSGLLSHEDCEGARYLPFIKGSAPEKSIFCRPEQAADKIINWFENLLHNRQP